MKILQICLLAVTCGMGGWMVADAAVPEVLNNSNIVELKQLGLGNAVIIEKIKTSRCDFDLSINGLKQLKSAAIPDEVLSAMITAKPAADTESLDNSGATDPNNPTSPHEPGIWLVIEQDGRPKMVELEPSVYSQSKSGSGIFAQFGAPVQIHAAIRGAHAELSIPDRQPAFYFYFERTQAGLSDNHGATSPNEYTLAKFESRENDNQRTLLVQSLNAYSGGQYGPDVKATRNFGFQKIGPGTYKVTVKDMLTDGEYGFFYGNTRRDSTGGKIFDFRIQGAPGSSPTPPLAAASKETTAKKNPLKSLFHKGTAAQAETSPKASE